MFGDFERQAIFDVGDGRQALRSRVPNLATNSLSVNCRNRPRIGHGRPDTSATWIPGYRRFRRQDDGIDPAIVTYKDDSDQSALLAQAVRGLKADGFNSRRSWSSARAAGFDSGINSRYLAAAGARVQKTVGTPRRGRLRYSTIHAFKGLEAPAVILTDLDDQSAPSFDSLLYIGMTRATDRLIAVIESKTLRAALGGTHDRS